MANPFTQYLRDTRGELRHVAWPTRTQTVIYALLVAGISIAVALYLGLFDFIFTAGLSHLLSGVQQVSTAQSAQTQNTGGITVTQLPTPSTGSSQPTTPKQ